jgi:YbgC/YbaW family acyl-CoA thioester hydrolase
MKLAEIGGLKPSVAEYEVEFRVEYADVDNIGVVHNGHYARFVERAFTAWVETHKGKSFGELQKINRYFVVSKATYQYARPLRFEDRARVRAFIEFSEDSALIHVTFKIYSNDLFATKVDVDYVYARSLKDRTGTMKFEPVPFRT